MKRLVVAGLLLLASVARAQINACVGTITLTYENPPGRPLIVGDVLHVRAPLGTGVIIGGVPPAIVFDTVQFDLDCDPTIPLVPPCPDIGPIISYNGDASITTNCPTTWTSNNPAGGFLPNQVEFTASPVLVLGPNIPNPPGFCVLGFDVTVEAIPANLAVGEIIGYKLEFCTNGLTSGNFQTADTIFAPVGGRHYDCYQTPRGGVPANTVTTVDRFGTLSLTLSDIHRLCAPADKEGEDPLAVLDPLHYAAYTIRSNSSFLPVRGLTLVNQFGGYTGDAVKPNFLLVPSSKGLNAFLPSIDAEHFVCYQMRNVKGPTPKDVTVTDQFLAPPGLDVDITTRVSLCVGATKNGANGGSDALMCFHTDGDRLPFPDKTVFLATQFGQKQLKITQFDELCVPTTIQ